MLVANLLLLVLGFIHTVSDTGSLELWAISDIRVMTMSHKPNNWSLTADLNQQFKQSTWQAKHSSYPGKFAIFLGTLSSQLAVRLTLFGIGGLRGHIEPWIMCGGYEVHSPSHVSRLKTSSKIGDMVAKTRTGDNCVRCQ